jgi:5'-deoxynucleotidase YfbR-like HD superfamily hydrolase
MTTKEIPWTHIKTAVDFVELTYKLDHIFRCSTVPILRPQSVAEHSFHVAQLAFIAVADLFEHLEVTDIVQDTFNSTIIINLALMHDVEEGLIGDILYPVKNANDLMKQACAVTTFDAWEKQLDGGSDSALSRNIKVFARDNDKPCFERRIVSICDMLELVYTMVAEMELGNRHKRIVEIYKFGADILPTLPEWDKVPTLQGLLQQLKVRFQKLGLS